MFSIGETVGLAEWIIDDSCLVLINSVGKNAVMKLGDGGNFFF